MIPLLSPTKVLDLPIVAWLRGSDETRYIQLGMTVWQEYKIKNRIRFDWFFFFFCKSTSGFFFDEERFSKYATNGMFQNRNNERRYSAQKSKIFSIAKIVAGKWG